MCVCVGCVCVGCVCGVCVCGVCVCGVCVCGVCVGCVCVGCVCVGESETCDACVFLPCEVFARSEVPATSDLADLSFRK